MFRDRVWITLALTIPTLVWSEMIQGWLRFTAPSFPGSAYIAPVFGTAVFLYGGWVFVEGAVRELRDRLPGMMTLISLAISVAFFFSLAVTLGYPGDALWWELATLVTIMLLGHWIEMRSIFQASGALNELEAPATHRPTYRWRADRGGADLISRRRRPGAGAAGRERPRGRRRSRREERRQRIDDHGESVPSRRSRVRRSSPER
jgi:cation transport ATPase